jgi:hypothetical protein
MKKMLATLTLLGFPFCALAQTIPATATAAAASDNWTEQVPTTQAAAQEVPQQPESEPSSDPAQDPVAHQEANVPEAPSAHNLAQQTSTGDLAEVADQSNLLTQEAVAEGATADGIGSYEVAGAQQASAAATGALSTGALVGIGVAASAVLYGAISGGDDDSSGSRGPTGTR